MFISTKILSTNWTGNNTKSRTKIRKTTMENRNLITLASLGWIVVYIFCLVVATILVINLTSPKINNGYYLTQCIGGQSSIWINWENRIDERAFQHPDINVVLQVYNQLNNIPRPPQPQPQPQPKSE